MYFYGSIYACKNKQTNQAIIIWRILHVTDQSHVSNKKTEWQAHIYQDIKSSTLNGFIFQFRWKGNYFMAIKGLNVFLQ